MDKEFDFHPTKPTDADQPTYAQIEYEADLRMRPLSAGEVMRYEQELMRHHYGPGVYAALMAIPVDAQALGSISRRSRPRRNPERRPRRRRTEEL